MSDAHAGPATTGSGPGLARRSVRCRRILSDDLKGLVALLSRGFPTRRPDFWERAFARMDDLARTQSRDPSYGFFLESAGLPVGVLLTIDRPPDPRRPEGRSCNLSSWYVEPEFRSYAPLLVAKATADPKATFVNISAAPNTRPVIAAQGFSSYATGMVLSAPLLARGPAEPSRVIAGLATPPVACEEADLILMRDHDRYGCLTAWGCTQDRALPFIFVRRDPIGRILPCAHLIYSADPGAFARFARPLGRFLATRGIFAVTSDANGPAAGLPGRYVARGAKYAKGPVAPRLGDLAYTEAALFGTMLSR